MGAWLWASAGGAVSSCALSHRGPHRGRRGGGGTNAVQPSYIGTGCGIMLWASMHLRIYSREPRLLMAGVWRMQARVVGPIREVHCTHAGPSAPRAPGCWDGARTRQAQEAGFWVFQGKGAASMSEAGFGEVGAESGCQAQSKAGWLGRHKAQGRFPGSQARRRHSGFQAVWARPPAGRSAGKTRPGDGASHTCGAAPSATMRKETGFRPPCFGRLKQ